MTAAFDRVYIAKGRRIVEEEKEEKINVIRAYR